MSVLGNITDVFPDKNIPNSEKDAAYILKTLQAIYARFIGYGVCQYDNGSAIEGTGNIFGSPWEAQKYRDFSRALNNGNKMRQAHQLNDADANGAQSAMKIHWEPSMVQWKLMATVEHMLTNRDTQIVAWAIDPTSVAKRTTEKFLRQAKVKRANDPEVKELNAAMGVPTSLPANEPQTEEELDIYEMMGPKDIETMMLTMAIDLMHNKTDYKRRVRPRIGQELRDVGIVGVAVEMSGGGIPVSRVIKAEDLVLPYTENNFHDMTEGGYIRYMTPTEIRTEAGNRLTEEEYKQVYKMAQDGDISDGRVYPFGPIGGRVRRVRGAVPVFVGFFKDTNLFAMSERKGRNGQTVYKKGEVTGGKWKVEREAFEVVYTGHWIVGTHNEPNTPLGSDKCISWGCELAYNLPRMENELYTTKLPMVVRAYNMTDMRVTSVAKLAMIKCVEIEELYIQLRDMIRKTIPPGLGPYNIQALQQSMEGLSMPAVTKVTHLLELFNQTGSVPFTPVDLDDPTGQFRSNQPMFQPHSGFIGDIERLSNAIDRCKAWLNETLGLNDASLGNTTDNKQLVGTLKIQMQGTATALGGLFACFDEIEEEVALLEYGMLQCALQEGVVLEGVSRLFGEPAEQWVRFSADDDPGSVGIEVRAQMTDEDKLSFNNAMDLAIQAGKIDGVDKALLFQVKDFNLAIRMLQARIKFREKQAHERQMEMIKANQEGSVQTTQMQAQAKEKQIQDIGAVEQQLIQMKGQVEIDKLTTKGQMDEARAMRELAYKQQLASEQIQLSMNQILEKLESSERIMAMANESKERIANNADATKREIAEELNETSLEIAEKQKNTPKPG